MDTKKVSHDIQNALSRLKIMFELAQDQQFEMISKEELLHDLGETLKELETNFQELINQ